MNKIVISILIFSLNTANSMDVGALYRHTQKAVYNEPITLLSEEGEQFVIPYGLAQQSNKLSQKITDLKNAPKIIKVPISNEALNEIIALLKALNQYKDLPKDELFKALDTIIRPDTIAKIKTAVIDLDIPLLEQFIEYKEKTRSNPSSTLPKTQSAAWYTQLWQKIKKVFEIESVGEFNE